MAIEQVRQSLESADESLGRAIAQLAEMRFAVSDYAVALDNAVEHLRSAVSGTIPEPDKDTIKPILQRIRTRAARVQALLDSAAAFYCGWTSVAPAGPDTYAPDGHLLREENGGRMMLSA